MKNGQKQLGIIGGLGPIATKRLMELVRIMSQPQREIDMLVCDFPSIPDQTGYLPGSNLRSPLPGLLRAGRCLAGLGADQIAVPSMTAHYFYEELSDGIPVKVINVLKETAVYLKSFGITDVGILATDGTLAAGLFTRELKDLGIRPVLPSAARQEDVMHLIYRNMKAGKPMEIERFRAVEQELRRSGAQAILLGSPELSVIKRDRPLNCGFLDAMEVLARQAVLNCGGQIKAEYDCLIT